MLHEASNDSENFAALQRGEVAALNRIISRWQRPLHGFAYRYCQNSADAEDLVAQAFARLYQQRVRLRADTKLSAWLFTTLTNLCHNHHRWQTRHPTSSLDAAATATEVGPGLAAGAVEGLRPPDEQLVHQEELSAVRTAISQLPHQLKATLILHHYDHLSYREISEITNCSERGVETRLYRARQQLKQLLLGAVGT